MTRLLMLLPASNHMAIAPCGVDRDTEIVFRTVRPASVSSTSAHDWALIDLAVLAAGQSAEEEGFDAVCVGAFGDYGVAALRSVLSIPVIGAGRGSMLYAMTLGATFSVVTPPSAYHRCKKLVGEYGLDRQCVSVRMVGADIEADDTPYAAAFDVILAAAQLCVDMDGADVICLATGFESDVATRLADRLPVPIVDPIGLPPKLAETFLGLGLSHSRRAYPEPQLRKPSLIQAIGGLAS